MAVVRPFRGMRPIPEKVQDVASPPYDVLNSNEARERVKGHPDSFLHVVKQPRDNYRFVRLYELAQFPKRLPHRRVYLDHHVGVTLQGIAGRHTVLEMNVWYADLVVTRF